MIGDRRVVLEYRGDALELPVGVINVGRDLSCALRIHDPAVSRRHLRFIHREDEVFVEDLSSTNGTLLNGRPIFQPIRLRDGDVLQLGAREIVVRINESSFFDDLEPQTLVTARSTREPDEAQLKSAAEKAERKKLNKAATTQISPRKTSKMVLPEPRGRTADQRCPKCGGVIATDEDECEWCGYSWGSFSPKSTTHVGPVALRERKHERHEVKLPLIYRSSTLEVEAETRDLSLGGLFVCSTILDAPGTEVELTILIDGGPPVSLVGRVCRVVRDRTAPSGPGMGVEFKDVEPDAGKWLETTIARQRKLEEEEVA